MNRIDNKSFLPLDQEEKDLMESIDRDEWQAVEDLDQERKKAIEASINTLKVDKN